MDEFRRRRQQLKEDIHKGQSKVHLSFDLWTSGNSMALLAIVAHFIDENYNNRTILIGLRRLRGSHSGENIAQRVIAVMEDFELVDIFRYFVLGNAESNNTGVDTIFWKLRPKMINKRHQRLRCIGHIINLTAKALLFGEDPDAFCMKAQVLKEMRSETRELNL